MRLGEEAYGKLKYYMLMHYKCGGGIATTLDQVEAYQDTRIEWQRYKRNSFNIQYQRIKRQILANPERPFGDDEEENEAERESVRAMFDGYEMARIAALPGFKK